MIKRRRFLGLWLSLLLASFGLHAEDRFFDSAGVRIHYTIEGQGEPVVLIHGFAANALMNWGAPGVIGALAQNYQVIAIDNRGHGQSDKPLDPEAYGAKMVEDVVRLLDHLQIKKAHIAGYSMGGFITGKLVTTHPERVLTATLGGAGWLREKDKLLDTLAESLEEGKGMAPLLTFLTPKDQPPPTPERIEAVNKMLLAFNDPKALAAVARGFGSLVTAENKLRANKVPVLAIIGDKDSLKDGVDQLSQVMANLKVVTIEGADHMSAFVRPEFTAALKSFLAEHPNKSEMKKAATAAR